MTRQQITFSLAGFTAGIIAVAAGRESLWVLTAGVGPLFFLAILAAIAFTGAWPHVRRGFWRYMLAACASTMAYVLALLTFWWLGGYLQSLLGTNGSNDLSEFRLDMWVGLIAAALIAAVCIELMAYILTGKWNNTVLARLVGAGILAIVMTFIAMRAVRSTGNLPPPLYYWSFFGILFSFGEALFCGLVGAQIWGTSQPQQQTVPAT
jgi:hypothetical protein